MSFRLKTIIGIAVIETVLLLILIFTVLNFLKQTQSEELSKRIKIANQLLTTTAQDAMISSDLATLDSITAEFFKNPGIIYIRMLDKNNNVLSQAGEYTRDDNPAILDVNPDLIEDISIVHTQAVIKAYNVVFGRIETGYSVAHFSEFYDKARSQTLAIAITEIILVAIFSFFLGTYLTSQLGSLKKAAEQISHGDYLVNIRSKGNDEIAKTVSAFNQMAERLDKLWHQQKNSYRLIQSVQEIQFEFIKTTDKSEYFASLLKHILDLTQSEFGFIAEIQTNLTQQYLKTVALSNIAWNDTTRNLYNENRQEELEFYNLNTLFGQPVLTKQPLITNSPGTHQGASDLPAGHPPLHSYLGIPLMHGNEIIGVAGIANRPSGYSDSVLQDYDLLWKSMANILYAYRAEKAQELMRQELSDRENYLSTLFENIFDAIISIDEKGSITNCNSATSQIFGYNKNELISNNVKMLMPEPFRGMHDFYLDNYRKKPRSDSNVILKSRELVAITSDGKYIPIELSVSRLHDTTGPSRYIGIIRDITEQKKYIEALQLANTRTRETAKAKTDFLAMMGTEIRTPINHMLDKLNAIDISELPEKQQHQIKSAFQSSNVILDIIDEVLYFSRIDTGEIIFYNEKIDLHELITDVISEFSKQLHEKKLKLIIDYPEGMAKYFSTDRKCLHQILSRLISNSVKFTSEGSITVRVEISDIDMQKANATIEIIDTGIGIKPHKLKAIFEPFSRVHNAYTQDNPASGLGLAICKRLVELIGGHISAQSKQGQGAKFWFTLPLTKAEP